MDDDWMSTAVSKNADWQEMCAQERSMIDLRLHIVRFLIWLLSMFLKNFYANAQEYSDDPCGTMLTERDTHRSHYCRCNVSFVEFNVINHSRKNFSGYICAYNLLLCIVRLLFHI